MVILSINCPTFEEAEKEIRLAESFLREGEDWLHIDVSDGKFSDFTSWGNAEELKSLRLNLNIEVHLMVEDPESVMEAWLAAGAKRVIIHLQSIKNPQSILDMCRKYGAEPMISFDPSVSVENGVPYFADFNYFQILSVFPGMSGQKFIDESLEKIKSLRARVPTAKIEVDGGINERTGRLAKDAGADVLVSGHYVFGSPNPMDAYEELKSI